MQSLMIFKIFFYVHRKNLQIYIVSVHLSQCGLGSMNFLIAMKVKGQVEKINFHGFKDYHI